MKKVLTGSMAALMMGISALAGATPAAAHDGYNYGGGYGDSYGYGGSYDGYGYGERHHDHDDGVGLAVGAGILALIVGVAIASHSNTAKHQTARYDTPQSDNGDYADQGARQQGYNNQKTCSGQGQIWDQNQGRYITRTVQYAC